MLLLLYIVFLVIVIAIITYRFGVNQGRKIFLVMVIFLVVPLASIYIPLQKVIISWNVFRVSLVPIFFYALSSTKYRNFRISSKNISFWFILYNVYTILNNLIVGGYFSAIELVNFIFITGFLLYIENADFQKEDLNRSKKILKIIALVVTIVSIIQVFIDPYFLISPLRLKKEEEKLFIQAFSDTLRNQSVFTGMILGEGWLFMGLLSIIILFNYYEKSKSQNLILYFLMVFAIYVTYTRALWLSIPIGVFLFVYFRFRKSRGIAIFIFIFIIIVIYSIYLPSIEQSDVYRERIMSESYTARFETINIFFKHLWDQYPIFGYGSPNPDDAYIAFGRKGGTLNGFIAEYIRSGIIGLFFFIMVFYKIFVKAKRVLDMTGNPVLLGMLFFIIVVNFTASVIFLFVFPYLFLFYCTELYYQALVMAPNIKRAPPFTSPLHV